jgi:hypothetical protein
LLALPSFYAAKIAIISSQNLQNPQNYSFVTVARNRLPPESQPVGVAFQLFSKVLTVLLVL